ncbi:MAG: hypothetical protein AAF519_07545 [Bacteroidota bacterium]
MTLLETIKYFELVTLVVGAVYYKKYSSSFVKYFFFLLGVVVTLEFTVWTMKQFFGMPLQNWYIYNILTSIQYVYYFILYEKVMSRYRTRQWVRIFLFVFLISVLVNFIFIQRLAVDGPFHSYSFVLGAVLLIVSIGLFFAEMLQTEKVLYFKTHLMFWISIGLFVFYTGVIPLILSINFLPQGISLNTLNGILFTLNFMMYACFSVGFIVSEKYVD